MNLYHGVWVALVTRFKNHAVDEPALQRMVDELSNRGVAGFVPLGTTGESPTLSRDERRRIIQLCVEAAEISPSRPAVAPTAPRKVSS